VLLVLASLLACRYWRDRRGPWQPEPLNVLLLLIGCSWLGEITGLTSLLGALWGGVLLSRLAPATATEGPAALELRQFLSLLTEVFLPLYFISVGMRIEAATLQQPQAWGLALLLTLLGLACKLLCAAGIRGADRAAGVDRWVVAFGLIPRGLPGLVFANAALDAGLIDGTLFASLVLMVSATTVLGLLLLSWRLLQIGGAAAETAGAGVPCP
jgi:Kef-type K+ transport system membrane component KefB